MIFYELQGYYDRDTQGKLRYSYSGDRYIANLTEDNIQMAVYHMRLSGMRKAHGYSIKKARIA